MGSSSESWCRLCTTYLNNDNNVTLFDKETPHIVVEKLRQFVNLPVSPHDNLPQKVCHSCVVNLDFCIQFVDRCRRVADLLLSGSNQDNIHSQLAYHYPYLYGSLQNTEANSQTVPFQPGAFFGPSQNILECTPTDGEKVATNDSNKVAMFRHDVNVDNMVVEVEPNAILTRPKLPARPKVAENVNMDKKSIKVRKILPKNSRSSAMITNAPDLQITIPNPNAVKTSNQEGQYMIPVTLITPCKTCNAQIKASSVQDIRNHVCSKKDKNVLCSVEGCDKKFFSQFTLRYHLRHYHKIGQISNKGTKTSSVERGEVTPNNASPQKKFVCSWPECTKSYRAESYLIEHHRKHTGDKPFTCSNCGKGFSRVLDVKKHELLKVCH